MKEKEDIKISLSTFFLFILIILIIILACFIIYAFKESQKLSNKNMDLDARLALIENEKVEKQENTTNTNALINSTVTNDISNTDTSKQVKSDVSTNDKVAICSLDNNHFYGYIDNGVLYYVIYNEQEIQSFGNAPEDKVSKYEKLNNIKKIKYYNNGTSTSPYLILLTEDGKLYTINLYSSLSQNQSSIGNITLLENSKNLTVNDFKVEVANYKFNLVLTLNDGNIKRITLFEYPQ